MGVPEAILVALIAAAAGIGGAFLGAWIAARESRANRIDAARARREARHDARLARFADQRRQLLTDLWISCDRHRREVEAQVEARQRVDEGHVPSSWPIVASVEPARAAYLALILLADEEVRDPAGKLLQATEALGRNHAQVEGQARAFEAVDDDAWNRDLDAWYGAANDFAAWASADLQGVLQGGPPDHD